MRRWNQIVTSSLLLAALASACGDETTSGPEPTTAQSSAAVTTLDHPRARGGQRCGQIDEFPIPPTDQGNIFPGAIVSAADGELWFTTGLPYLGRMSPADQSVSLVPIPAAAQHLALGPEGNIWFTTGTGVAHLAPRRGTIREIALPDLGFVGDLAAGRDGDVWALGFNDIARVTAGGRVTLYPIVSGGASSGDTLVVGADGNVWYARPVNTTRFIHRLNQDGTVTDFALPPTGSINDLARGPDGAIWFTTGGGNPGDNSIGRITLAGVASTVVQLPDSANSPYQPPTDMPLVLTEGPDRKMYFTTYLVVPLNYIGQVTVDGQLARFDIPTSRAASFGITAGRDGNIWFTENFNQQIGRLDLASCHHRRRP